MTRASQSVSDQGGVSGPGNSRGQIEIVFVDRLTLSSLLRIAGSMRRVRTIWTFDPPRATATRLLQGLRTLRVMRAEIRQIPYNVADVWDENGNFDYKKIWGNVRSTTLRIRREEIEPSPFIGMTGSDGRI